MKTWIWTFGVGSQYKGKYVIVETVAATAASICSTGMVN